MHEVPPLRQTVVVLESTSDDLAHKQLKDDIVAAVRKGNFESVACLAHGVTHQEYREMCTADRKFAVAILQAKAKCEMDWLKKAVNADDDKDSKRWLLILEKRFSARWDSSGGSRSTGWEADEVNADPDVVARARAKQRERMGITA